MSRYPRRGEPIGPQTLREILDVPVPVDALPKNHPELLKFSDLDARVWEMFSPKVCQRLGELVVDLMRKAVQKLPTTILERHLPQPPSRLELKGLDLENRTMNGLTGLGRSKYIQDLGNLKVKDVLAIKGLGARSLVDILSSLESFADRPRKERASEQADDALVRLAKQIRQSGYVEIISSRDPRLGPLIRGIDPKAGNLSEILDRLINESFHVDSPERLSDRLRGLRERVRDLSRKPLEDELRDFAQVVGHGRNQKMALRYLGWDGGGGTTLQTVAGENGLTRERVRQIVSRLTTSLEKRRPFCPRLDEALEIIGEKTPGIADDIESDLLAKGVTQKTFHLEGVVSAGQSLDRDVPFEVKTIGGRRLVVPADTNVENRVLRTAKRDIRLWGVATVADVTAAVAEEGVVTDRFVSDLLASQPGFRWLDQTGGWFWLRDVPRNRVLSRLEKVLAVANGIKIGELRSALSRHYRMKGFAPPQRVLLELCRQVPGYYVEGDRVFADPVPDWEEVLAETEQIMVRILKEHDSVMQRVVLENLCQRAGMKRPTFYVHLDNSPVITRYVRGVYGLPGADIAPGMIEALAPEYRRGKVIQDYGWSSDRKLWLVLRLSAANISTGVFGVPAAIRRFLLGEFRFVAGDGVFFGTIVCKENGAWGLGPFFRRRGGDPGDYLALVFDPTARVVVGSLGDESLLEEVTSRVTRVAEEGE